MPKVEARLADLGLTLPPAVKPPPGVVLPFRFVRVLGKRGLVSGHSPQAAAKKALDKLAPSLALALRVACGVRVCNPANAVRFRGNDDRKG